MPYTYFNSYTELSKRDIEGDNNFYLHRNRGGGRESGRVVVAMTGIRYYYANQHLQLFSLREDNTI